ncbi:hypothetical protein QN362_15870 [Actimicrobium sp. CCC2.4]|uniref:alpha/beta fold hydrolase n=1 Tax=Actimicrobium sp. CCC2.4 TaxID=3048606 RepID=UPI002AC9500F|nr:hypothetical protein [Actimicrobium sp. CCC2.4]MEB0136815.1 hypothetical protein [Actimicrobium sp. CCC2.4]WPX33908.1 hypothetical protein RHM62_08905 [Actimicrobium sp. CCC2.4]
MQWPDTGQARAVRRFCASPCEQRLAVLTAQQTVLQGGDDWLDLHRELAAMSASGRQHTIANAGHYIQLDRPDVVIDAIAEVMRAARAPPSRPAGRHTKSGGAARIERPVSVQ